MNPSDAGFILAGVLVGISIGAANIRVRRRQRQQEERQWH